MFRVGAFLLAASALAFPAFACGGEATEGQTSLPTPTNESESAGYTEGDVEYQLAVIDEAIAPGDVDDPTIDKYATALDKLQRKCKDERRRIADMAVRSTEILQEDTGTKPTTLEMLRSAEKAIPKNFPGKQPCADIFTSLVLLMEKG